MVEFPISKPVPRPRTKTAPPSLEEVTRRYGWHICNAMRQKIAGMQKAVDDAKRSLEEKVVIVDEKVSADMFQTMRQRRESTIAMIEEVEFMIREYTEAFEALRKAGLK